MSAATLFGLCGAALIGLGLYGLIIHPQALRKILGFNLIAYSSVSLRGLIAAVGMGLANGDRGTELGVAFYAAHHILAKGALFLVIGVVTTTGSARLWPVFLPAAVVALGLGGLPLTGGFLAKLAVKETLGQGAVGLLSTLSAAGSTLLMMHFLHCLRNTAVREVREGAPTGLVAPWLVMAIAAVVVPWVLYFAAAIGSLSEVLSLAGFWAALWPTLVGGLFWIGLRRWAQVLPDIPEGDIVVAGEAAAMASVAWGAALEHADTVLRRWPVACLSLLIVAIILGALMLAG